MNSAQVLLAAADMVKAKAESMASDFDGQRYLCDSEQQQIDRAIDGALRPPTTEAMVTCAEIRDVLRRMDDDARYAFLDSVKGTRDERMVQYSIASLPPALSGVSYGIHKQARDALLEQADPTLLSRPAQLQQRRDRLAQCEAGFRRTVAELVDFDKAEAVRALAEPSS